MIDSSSFSLFVGRFHIVLLHFPIGCLLLLGGLELAARVPKLRQANASAGCILALAAPASVLTAVCGWLLADSGGYDAELLFWHRWLGAGCAILTLVTAGLWRFAPPWSYRLALSGTVLMVIAAGHLGGSLTHGKDFLTRHAPGPLRRLAGEAPARLDPREHAGPPAAGPVFATVIQPVLDRTCVSCHGPEKTKGGLRLDSLEAILRGGDSGPAVRPGQVDESALMGRMLLPADHDDHMPPEGKPQPTAEDLALLRWWIALGAPGESPLSDLNPEPEILQAVDAIRRQ